VTRLRSHLRAEQGQGIVSALILLAGVLLPLLFVVPLFARLEQGRLEAEQAARDAVRAAVEAPNGAAAQAAATDALARAQTLSGTPLRLQLSGAFARGSVLTARVQTQVAFASLPFVGRFGTIELDGRASAPVDRYRSLLIASSP
jgi:type II secretory pathway component PulM